MLWLGKGLGKDDILGYLVLLPQTRLPRVKNIFWGAENCPDVASNRSSFPTSH